jgi:hypothetical protein
LRAGKTTGLARHEAIVLAKSHAAAVERGRRRVLEDASQTTFFIAAIKRSEIAARFSAAAEALQQAGDALEGSLSE